MKLLRNKWMIAALCALLLVGLFFVCRSNKHRIDAKTVLKVSFGSTPEFDGWSVEDTETFIDLFNRAKYAGEGTGEGGTPEISVYVYFKDGSYMCVNDFGGKGRNIEVTLFNSDKKTYYLNSEDLEAFILEMLDKRRT